MKYEVERLKNGLEVVFVDNPGTTAASVQIWFRAGSTLEEKSNEGIAHFLEHMFFKGTPTRPGAQIAHEVESFGGEINAFTSFDYTCYYINTPNTRLPDTINILLDMVSNPLFSQKDLIPEREVVFEEYRRSLDNPNQYSFQKMQKACFTGGYSHQILGNEETIKNFSQEQLIEFRNNFYNNENSFLVVAGSLEKKQQYINEIEKFSLPKGTKTTRPKFKLKKKSTIEIHNKDVRMCQLSVTIQSPAMDSTAAASEDLAYNALGHGESSPLYKEIVLNKAIANNCASSTMFFSEGGIHFLRINFPYENYDKALKQLEKTLSKVIKDGLKQDDIDKIKNQYVASKLYEKESIESYSFSLGSSFAQSHDLESETKFINNIRKTPLKSVNNAYKEIFSRPIHLSLQLPNKIKITPHKKSLQTFIDNISKVAQPIREEKLKVNKSKNDESAILVELKPGINLFYRQNAMTPTFVMHAYMKGGLTEESKKTNGIYHFMSSLLPKGYKGLSYDKLKLALENKSAIFSNFSGKNAYGLTLHGQTDHFKELTKHFMSSLLEPSFQNKFFTHEKKIVSRNLEAQEEDATRQCFKQVSDDIFGNHPYSRSILGTKESMKNYKIDDLKKLHQKNINSKEILLSYSGDLSLEEVIEHLNPYVDKLKKRKVTPTKIKPIKKNKANTSHIEFEREQTQIFIGLQSPILTNKENLYLKMLTTHLSGQSSELFVDVRDRKGLCYVAQPIHMNSIEGGYWGIYMASGHDKVKDATQAIHDIINRLKSQGLSREEFDRIKLMIEGQNQINLQVNDDYVNVYSIPILHGFGIEHFHKVNKSVLSLSYEEFQKGIKKALNKPLTSVTVGRSSQ